MSELNEKVEQTGTEEIQATKLEDAIQPEGRGKKILKWVIRGAVVIATAVTGFILGRSTAGNDDDNDSEETTDEEAS